MNPDEYQAALTKVIQALEDLRRNVEASETPTTAVLAQVKAERARQDQKWGGPAHDNTHTMLEWVNLIKAYAQWSWVVLNLQNSDEARNKMIQVAALAVAVVEWMDRQAKLPESLSAAEDYVRKKAGLPPLPRACNECKHLHLRSLTCLYPNEEPAPGGVAYPLSETSYHRCRPLWCPLAKGGKV